MDDKVAEAARKELAEEDFEQAVQAAKVKLKANRAKSIWHKIFPFKITIKRK